MKRVRLGAVGYLNARPLVFGLERSSRFDLRFDMPSRCADLLHHGAIDVGLIPSIEYLRNGSSPAGAGRHHVDARSEPSTLEPYRIVPGVAIASRGPVASVLLYTTRPIADVRSIAIDTSSRTSAALLQVLCARRFRIRPAFEPYGPDLASMLARCDAALIIGDYALFLDSDGRRHIRPDPDRISDELSRGQPDPNGGVQLTLPGATEDGVVEKIDLGDVWTAMTSLPFVYAFWAGRDTVLTPEDVRLLQDARDAGVRHPEEIAREYVTGAAERLTIGTRYLRDNIQYRLGDDERAGLELFYRYAVEEGVVLSAGTLLFYQQ